MDNKIYQDDDFEQFLQDEVKQHRMYPSDHIWKNIRTEMHGYKAWPALTFISLFIITALTISTLLNNHPVQHIMPVNIAAIVKKQTIVVQNIPSAAKATEVSEKDYFQSIAPEQITAETFADLNLNESIIPQYIQVARKSELTAAPVKILVTNDRQNLTNKMVDHLSANFSDHLLQNLPNTLTAYATEDSNEPPAITENLIDAQPKNQTLTEKHSGADDFLKDFGYVQSKPVHRNSKFGFQFYVTPSTSYRRLSDEKVKEIIQPANASMITSAQNVPLSSNYSADVNNVVRHKPAMGLEMGFAVLYNMSDRLKFKTGVQLNVRQYYIETFQSTNDLTSLQLINYRGVETISFYSPYNNNTGFNKTQLDNKVYQLSVPLGIQWDVIKGKHLGINTEASVQPTFTLNNNTYLLSTDYKHYTSGSDFIRKWNINTSLGLNVTYQSGANSWQLGPQIRYQHLPTYTNLYPIKEYLMDYGVRLGFTRQIK